MATPSIKEELGKLVQLQEIDTQIFALTKERAEMPGRRTALADEFEEKKAKLKALEENKQKLQLKQKEKEVDLGSKEDSIKKTQSQLGQLKTNKDYQLKLAEIEGLKADKSLNEEDILKMMDEIDALKKAIESEKKSLEDEEKVFKEKQGVLDERARQIEGALADIQGKRKILASSVDKGILQSYEHILHGKDGLALVSVQDNSCHGCFMKVPHQVINEIKMHERLITCGTCARILYLEDDVRP